MSRNLISPLLQKYLKAYEANPKSRVFAPLAENYRKLGMIDKAIEVLNRGIKNHPTYVLGYLCLAHCYFDLGKYELCYSTIRPFVEEDRENLRLQKLFADCCYQLNKLDEALDSYKFLLYINPRDVEAIEKVQELEKIQVLETKHEIPYFEEQDLNYIFEDDVDDWTQIDLSVEKDDDIDLIVFSEFERQKEITQAWPDNEKKKISEELPPEIKIEKIDKKEETKKTVMTHSLVDLYCQQGHFDKAKELLNKMLELDPDNEKTKIRLDEIESIMPTNDNDVLMSIYDEKIGKNSKFDIDLDQKNHKIEKLEKFLRLIQDRSMI